MNKYALKSIEEYVKHSIEKAKFISPYVVLGVSGGPDSMALLYAFHKLGIQVLGVHINYGLRGKDSDLDQELVEGMCFEWGFECCSLRIGEKEGKGNFQNWARKERYRVFHELKDEFDADLIATAHHKGDHLETIFQKLMRGGSPESWKGISLWSEGIFRPLLDVTKEEIIEYCEQNAIPYRIDKSNLESKYTRNFFRNELAIQLDQFFPGWEKNLLNLSKLGSISGEAIEELLKVYSVEDGLSIKNIELLSRELRIALIKKFIENSTTNWLPTKGILYEIDQLIASQAGKEVKVGEHTKIIRNSNTLVLKTTLDEELYPLVLKDLHVGEFIKYDFASLVLSDSLPVGGELFVDAEKLQWPIKIRRWKNADRFVPFGMENSQKISDHLTNRKISASKKEKALVLCGSDGTIYAIIFPEPDSKNQFGTISEKVKCSKATKAYLTVKYNTQS